MIRWVLRMLAIIGWADRRRLSRPDPDKRDLMVRHWRLAQAIASATGGSPRAVLHEAYRRADEALEHR